MVNELSGVKLMKHKEYKYFIDFEKEEKWLNGMAEKGMNFIDFKLPGRYLFEEGKPGEYVYRLELLEHRPKHPQSKAYIEFMEETGVELVATYFRWAWFRKKTADGLFDLYTDYSSRIQHYQRVSWFVGSAGLLNFIVALNNFLVGLLYTGPHNNGYLNVYISPINFVVAIMCAKALTTYLKQIKKFKKESLIHE